MASSVLDDITSPYTAVESWLYDAIIAPGILKLKDRALSSILKSLPEGASVLDVGCGGGQIVASIAQERPDLQITGLDLSKEQVFRARNRMAHLALKAEIVEGSALSLPFPDQSFDCILSVASIKHWPDRLKGTSECLRVLKHGGKLFIVEAIRGCEAGDAENFVKMWRIPRFLRKLAVHFFITKVAEPSLTKDEAREILEKAGSQRHEVTKIDELPGFLICAEKQ